MASEQFEQRPDPEQLLEKIRKDQKRRDRGQLKIFFGACAGVGKTYAMLQEAQAQKAAGVDVVVGLAETHEREETKRLLEGLEILPKKELPGRSSLHEFDIDAALRRSPRLIVVDELAHTNLPGSRHQKRWQDVEELLDAGIDVYTALNVQHLESLNDVVEGITGIHVRETVPDWVFNDAEEVKLVDLPAAELLKRLEEGKIYLPNIARRAAKNFFRKGNIIALRELALRKTADRVDEQMRAYRQESAIASVWQAQDRLLVAVGGGEEDGKVIRETARLAGRMKAEWIAVHVEVPGESDDDRRESFEAMHLAEQLGGETTVLSGANRAELLAEYASRRNVTKIVIGVRQRRGKFLQWPDLADRIQQKCPYIDIIQISLQAKEKTRRKASGPGEFSPLRNYFLATLACALTIATAAFLLTVFEPANVIILIFLMAVCVAIALGIGPAAWVVVLSALSFDYFYVPPTFQFTGDNAQYLFTFGLILVVSLGIGRMAAHLKRETALACSRDFRSSSVAGFARELASAVTREEVRKIAQSHLPPILQAEVRLALPDEAGRLHFEDGSGEGDIEVAQWSYDHAEEAGLGTQTLSASRERTVPVCSAGDCFAVASLLPADQSQFGQPDTRRLIDGCMFLMAQTLQRISYAGIARQSMEKDARATGRSAMVGAVTQDIARPVVAIRDAADRLLQSVPPGEALADVLNIRSQAGVLLRLTGNLKDVVRLQVGDATLEREAVKANVIAESVSRVFRTAGTGKTLVVKADEDLPEVRVDVTLVRRALSNLIDNAVKYAPAGSEVEVQVEAAEGGVMFSVRDQGPGLPQDVLAFFERGERPEADLDQAENVGLGLALVRLTAQAYGGKVSAANLPQGGARMQLWLPAEKEGTGALRG